MKLGTILVALFFAVCGLAGVVFLSYDFNQIESAGGSSLEDDLASELPISETGPWPKAVADETTYDFGAMEVGANAEFVFVIKNEGEAPLKLLKGPTTCRCTLSEVAQEPVPPGESAEVRLEWEMSEVVTEFRQTADIFTNDPDNRTITFEITGSGVEMAQFQPSPTLALGNLEEGEPLTGVTFLSSGLVPEFEITEITTSSPSLTVTHSPMPQEGLAEFQAQSGYQLDVTLQPDIPVGSFNGVITVKTDIKDGKEFSAEVSALRVGPISVLPSKGVRWFPERSLVYLDRFSAAKGLSTNLFLFVRGLDVPFEYEIVEIEPDWLQAELVPQGGRPSLETQRYILKLTVPPDSPPIPRTASDPAIVRISTNHPELPELKFKIQYIIY